MVAAAAKIGAANGRSTDCVPKRLQALAIGDRQDRSEHVMQAYASSAKASSVRLRIDKQTAAAKGPVAREISNGSSRALCRDLNDDKIDQDR